MARAKKAPVVKSVIIDGAPVIERAIVRFSHIVLQFTVENGDQISYEVLETPVNPEVADAIEYATVRFSEVVCQFVVTDGTTVHAYELEPVYQEIGGGSPAAPIYSLNQTSFDGTNPVISGVKLFDEDKDYTLTITFNGTGLTGAIIRANDGQSPHRNQGLSVIWVDISPYLRANNAQQTTGRTVIDKDHTTRMVITHSAGNTYTTFKVFTDGLTSEVMSYTIGAAINPVWPDVNVIFGENWSGIIYDAEIYDVILDDATINAYLNGGE